MIKRIVRLAFEKGQSSVFINEILPQQKHFTRHFDGCQHLEIWVDVQDKDLLYSFSIWESEDALNNYRKSPKFKSFWAKTKLLFRERATAFSAEVVEVL